MGLYILIGMISMGLIFVGAVTAYLVGALILYSLGLDVGEGFSGRDVVIFLTGLNALAIVVYVAAVLGRFVMALGLPQ